MPLRRPRRASAESSVMPREQTVCGADDPPPTRARDAGGAGQGGAARRGRRRAQRADRGSPGADGAAARADHGRRRVAARAAPGARGHDRGRVPHGPVDACAVDISGRGPRCAGLVVDRGVGRADRHAGRRTACGQPATAAPSTPRRCSSRRTARSWCSSRSRSGSRPPGAPGR